MRSLIVERDGVFQTRFERGCCLNVEIGARDAPPPRGNRPAVSAPGNGNNARSHYRVVRKDRASVLLNHYFCQEKGY